MEVNKKGSGTVLGVEHTEMKKHDPALKDLSLPGQHSVIKVRIGETSSKGGCL